jgi:hypothetical protein
LGISTAGALKEANRRKQPWTHGTMAERQGGGREIMRDNEGDNER